MISISTTMPVSTITNNIVFQENRKSKLAENTARSTLIPTLDGGAVMINAGVSESDRTMSILAKINKAQAKMFLDFFNTQNQVIISCSEGVFLGHIHTISTDNGELKMTIYVISKES